MHGTKRSSSYAALHMCEHKSVLSKLQRTLSLSLLKSRSDAPSSSSRRTSASSSHAFARDSTSVRSSRDDDGLSDFGGCVRTRSSRPTDAPAHAFESNGLTHDTRCSWDLTRSYSSASGTSGSRMLSDFYNLVLESERSTFFKDKHGKRVKGCVVLFCRLSARM